MKITDLLDQRSISLNATPATKSQALDQLVELMDKSGKISDVESYRQKVYAREEDDQYHNDQQDDGTESYYTADESFSIHLSFLLPYEF